MMINTLSFVIHTGGLVFSNLCFSFGLLGLCSSVNSTASVPRLHIYRSIMITCLSDMQRAHHRMALESPALATYRVLMSSNCAFFDRTSRHDTAVEPERPVGCVFRCRSVSRYAFFSVSSIFLLVGSNPFNMFCIMSSRARYSIHQRYFPRVESSR